MLTVAQYLRDLLAKSVRRAEAIEAAVRARYEFTGRHEDVVRRRAVMRDVIDQAPWLGLRVDQGRDCNEVKRVVVKKLGGWPQLKANARIYRGMRRR